MLALRTTSCKTFQVWLWDTSSREGLESATTPRCSSKEIIRTAVDLNTVVSASLCQLRPASIGSLRKSPLRVLDCLLARIPSPMKTWHTLRHLISSTDRLWDIKTSARISNYSQITGICRASRPCSISRMRRRSGSTISRQLQIIRPHNGLFHMQSLWLGKIWRRSQIETRQGRTLRSMTEERASNYRKLSCSTITHPRSTPLTTACCKPTNKQHLTQWSKSLVKQTTPLWNKGRFYHPQPQLGPLAIKISRKK